MEQIISSWMILAVYGSENIIIRRLVIQITGLYFEVSHKVWIISKQRVTVLLIVLMEHSDWTRSAWNMCG